MKKDMQKEVMKMIGESKNLKKKLEGLTRFLLKNHPDVAREYFGKEEVNKMMTEEL